MTDAEKLRLLAAWLDITDRLIPGIDGACEVQQDLRRIADRIDEHEKEETWTG